MNVTDISLGWGEDKDVLRFFLCVSPYLLFSTMHVNYFSNHKRSRSYTMSEDPHTCADWSWSLESARLRLEPGSATLG